MRRGKGESSPTRQNESKEYLLFNTSFFLAPVRMAKMGKKNQPVVVVDPTAWMIDNDVAHFLLLHQKEVMYMCMVSISR